MGGADGGVSATDELRRLLDERGVEYTVVHGYQEYIWEFGESGIARASRIGTKGLVQMIVTGITPEQAIAATLGSCNCSNDCTNSERTETCEMEYVTDWMSWHCKSCDHMDMAPRNPKPRYCKWCGRKVVDV